MTCHTVFAGLTAKRHLLCNIPWPFVEFMGRRIFGQIFTAMGNYLETLEGYGIFLEYGINSMYEYVPVIVLTVFEV